MPGIFTQFEERDPGPLTTNDYEGYEPATELNPEDEALMYGDEGELDAELDTGLDAESEDAHPLEATVDDDYGYEEEVSAEYNAGEPDMPDLSGLAGASLGAELPAPGPEPGSSQIAEQVSEYLAHKAKERSAAAERFQQSALRMNTYGK